LLFLPPRERRSSLHRRPVRALENDARAPRVDAAPARAAAATPRVDPRALEKDELTRNPPDPISSQPNLRSTYRSKPSSVDESLFGTKKSSSASTNSFQRKTAKPSTASSAAKSTKSSAGSDYLVLSSNDIDRMRKPASVLTPHEVSAIKAERQAEKELELMKSKQMRERMSTMEARRGGASKGKEPSETEVIAAAKSQSTLNRAELLREEALDEVKNMNQMMLYSKCVTIRDAQLEEKKHILAEAQEEERRMDLMMEIERMKALDVYEEREKQRAEDRMKGAAVLRKQIEDRAKERAREEELLDLDRKQMLSEIQRVKDEAAAEAQRKRDVGKKLLAEVSKANAAQIERKKLIIQAERDEEERIAQYIADRDARELAEQMERDRVAHEIEMETVRMRAQQEKQADTQAEMDELRAMRVQEAHERAYREKERAAVARKRAINEDLARAREHQKMLKMKQLSDQARQDQSEFFRVVDVQMAKEEEEAQQSARLAALRKQHKEELQAQINFNEERRLHERREFLEEGDSLRKNMMDEQARLESIKQRKLDELSRTGVPTKYLAELARKKINA
jgi:hypothetical protein